MNTNMTSLSLLTNIPQVILYLDIVIILCLMPQGNTVSQPSKGLSYFVNSMLKSMWVNKDLLTWLDWLAALTHWGRVTHICISKLTIIGSDNGLSPDRRQAIIWTNSGILLIGPLGTNLSETLIAILTFSFEKMHLKVSSAKWRPFCLGLNVLIRTRFENDVKQNVKTGVS